MPVSSAARGGTAITAAQMRTYLGTTQPPAGRFSAALGAGVGALKGLDLSDQADMAARASKMLAAERKMLVAIDGVAKVKAPGDLRAPHAHLVQGLRLDVSGLNAIAKALASGTGIDSAESVFEARTATAADLVKDWTSEVTVVLRRLQMVVPLWVKQLGK